MIDRNTHVKTFKSVNNLRNELPADFSYQIELKNIQILPNILLSLYDKLIRETEGVKRD